MRAAVDETLPRSTARLVLLGAFLLIAFVGFVALGTWQVHRRAWKLDLIDRVERRVHAPPVAAPGREAWPGIGSNDEYLRVQAEGVYLLDREVFVQAVTARGSGYWVMTPLQIRVGSFVLVNRGFIEADQAAAFRSAEAGQSAQPVEVSGLLRLSEPGGGFLRHNDPAAQRWFSRDVAAIAASRKLPAEDVAPYFIDADAAANPDAMPVGGMTVLRFHNSHLVYAITWYTLALMVAGAAGLVGREEWRRRSSRGLSQAGPRS